MENGELKMKDSASLRDGSGNPLCHITENSGKLWTGFVIPI